MMAETTVTAKPWYVSKVLWFNALSVAIFFLASDEIKRLIPSGGEEAYVSLVGLVNLGLRFLTSGPLTGSSETAKVINQKIAPVILIALATFASACALRGKPVERQLAIIGIQVNDGLRNVGETAKQLNTSKVLTNEQYLAFLKKLDEAFAQSSRLADALAAYDAAAGPETASQVKAALDALAVLVPGVTSGLGGGPGVQKVVELVANVNKLLITISSGLKPSAQMNPGNIEHLMQWNRERALEAN
jgi:hypothetical protein